MAGANENANANANANANGNRDLNRSFMAFKRADASSVDWPPDKNALMNC